MNEKAETRKFTVTTSCLYNLSIAFSENNFAFIVGDRKYQMNKVLAALISKKVAQNLAIDSTINTYTLKFKDPQHEFSKIIDLISGDSITITQNNAYSLICIADEIDNEDLKQKALEVYKYDLVKLDDLLKYDHSENIFKYAASNFYKIPSNTLVNICKLDSDIIRNIINNECLLVENENSLFDFVFNSYTYNHDSSLFECIDFTQLSVDKIRSFCMKINHDQITSALWERISERLSFDMKYQSSPKHRSYVKDQNIALNKDQTKKTSKSQSFLLAPPKKQKRIVQCPNGIVSFLKQSNVNVVPTASSSKSNSTAPQNAIDGEDSTYFLSKGIPNQWWQIDFVKRVRVDSYLPTNNGSWSPANWVVEVSDDAHLWNIIDVQQSSNFIKNKTRFNIENPIECRYLRFRMTGKTTDGHDDIIIYNIEFYGAVIAED